MIKVQAITCFENEVNGSPVRFRARIMVAVSVRTSAHLLPSPVFPFVAALVPALRLRKRWGSCDWKSSVSAPLEIESALRQYLYSVCRISISFRLRWALPLTRKGIGTVRVVTTHISFFDSFLLLSLLCPCFRFFARCCAWACLWSLSVSLEL